MNRRLILFSALASLCVSVGLAIYWHSLAAAAFPLLALIAESISFRSASSFSGCAVMGLLAFSALGILAWRRGSTPWTALFCGMLLLSSSMAPFGAQTLADQISHGMGSAFAQELCQTIQDGPRK